MMVSLKILGIIIVNLAVKRYLEARIKSYLFLVDGMESIAMNVLTDYREKKIELFKNRIFKNA
jgi:hypothetical protein